jgi:HAD superfamily hydrolase (TIGR01509 family)
MAPALIALDLMDTVLVDPFFVDVPRLLGRPIEQVVALLDGQAWVAFETGAIDETTYLARMFRTGRAPADIAGDDLKRTILDGCRFLPGMEQLLADLCARATRIWALSNYSPWMVELRRRLDLDRYFEGYVVSYETGFRKPDPRAYRDLFQRAGVEPPSCLFVDDRQVNVEAARQLGMTALLFKSAAQLRQQLAGLGVVV